MEAVYGVKRQSGRGVCETWMDRFVELEPEGGFRSVVQQAWSHSVPISGATTLALLNGRNGMKPVYGRKHLTTGAGAAVTWMDRFVEMEPEGGFRAVVQLQLNRHAGDAS